MRHPALGSRSCAFVKSGKIWTNRIFIRYIRYLRKTQNSRPAWQYRGSFAEDVCLSLARGWVQAKIRNSRTLLRRNWRRVETCEPVLKDLKRLAERARRVRDIASLLGVEGAAAARYFQHFQGMLRQETNPSMSFEMDHRNRRPPSDPVNAMLSFGYALLTRAFVTVLSATGFDAYRGFLHQPRFGRPALALDMMEPFRSLIVDSVVVTAINNGEVRPTDFVRTPIGVNLSDSGRKRFIRVFERRLSQEVTHPLFGYRVEYRRLLEIQARLLGRFLAAGRASGRVPGYGPGTARRTPLFFVNQMLALPGVRWEHETGRHLGVRSCNRSRLPSESRQLCGTPRTPLSPASRRGLIEGTRRRGLRAPRTGYPLPRAGASLKVSVQHSPENAVPELSPASRRGLIEGR